MEPIINLDDPAGKTVGRERRRGMHCGYALGLQRALNQIAPLPIPRGVYRFRSHEEADQWLMDRLTRKRAS